VRPDYLYHQLRAPNVIGTRNVVEFVCTGGPKVLHLPSPASVFLAPAYAGRPTMAEDEFPESPLGIVSGYGQSKWAAESLARQARDRGAAVVVYRATALLGAAENGYWSPTDLGSLALSASLATGSMSNATRALDGIPVDVAAQFIAAVSAEPANQGQTFHLVHPHALSVKQWTEVLAKHDIAARAASDDEWAGQFESLPSGRLYEGLFEVRGTGVNATIMECLPDQPALDGTAFKKALSRYKVACPAYDKLIERGWLDALRQQ
jgi:thioester reductase-like protein